MKNWSDSRKTLPPFTWGFSRRRLGLCRWVLLGVLALPLVMSGAIRLQNARLDTQRQLQVELQSSEPGAYILEASNDLLNWRPIATNQWLNGIVRFEGLVGPEGGQSFYRGLLQDASFVPGQVLVSFRPGIDRDAALALVTAVPAVVTDVIAPSAVEQDQVAPIYVAETDLPVAEAIRRLASRPEVLFVQPNRIYQFLAKPNDPRYTDGSQWGLQGSSESPFGAFGTGVMDAWTRGEIGSSQVYVGAIDTGVQVSHPDLQANYETGMNVLRGSLFLDAQQDGHGTLVAGVIGAAGGNALGIAGINWQVRLIVCKTGRWGDGTTSAAVRLGYDYIRELRRTQGFPIVAINCSWGAYATEQEEALFDSVVYEGIRLAGQSGILTVAAAGNDGRDTDPPHERHYPSSFDTTPDLGFNAVISVASIDKQGQLRSNYGASTVHLAAPGDDIVSTYPGDTYGSFAGTSLAAPHVTGAIALYASTHPNATPQEIREAILGSTLATPSLAGKCSTGGRLDLSTVTSPDVVYVDQAYGLQNGPSNGTRPRPYQGIPAGLAVMPVSGIMVMRANGIPYGLGGGLLTKAGLYKPEGGSVFIQP